MNRRCSCARMYEGDGKSVPLDAVQARRENDVEGCHTRELASHFFCICDLEIASRRQSNSCVHCCKKEATGSSQCFFQELNVPGFFFSRIIVEVLIEQRIPSDGHVFVIRNVSNLQRRQEEHAVGQISWKNRSA